MRKGTRHRKRSRFRPVESDGIDQAARCASLAIGSILFLFGLVFIVAGGNQVTGVAIIISCIAFLVLARWFKKIKIKGMGFEIEAE